jgi:hypothetical protein
MVSDRIHGPGWHGALLFSAALALTGCRSDPTRDPLAPVRDGRYDSNAPVQSVSEHLARVGESVKMLSTVAYYRNYIIPASARLTAGEVTPAVLARYSPEATYTNTTLAASTIILSCQARRILLLSSAHVLDYPDTTLAFHADAEGRPGTFVRAVSVKEKQVNYVAVLPEGGELEILAIDSNLDVAILGRSFFNDPCPAFKPADLPRGNASELEWGTYVFIFGYPSGVRMVTAGIVSSPRRDRNASFLVDAASNRGFSGGPVLALRDGVPNFELVGTVRQVSVHASYVLVPEREDGREYDPGMPYQGRVFPERLTEIDHGMTQVTSSEVIHEFLESSRERVESLGYSLAGVLPARAAGGAEPD